MANQTETYLQLKQTGLFAEQLASAHARFSKRTARKKIRIHSPRVGNVKTIFALTFTSLAFRSLDWVQVIHEGLIYEKRGRGKIDEERYFQQSVPLAGGQAYCTTEPQPLPRS